MRKVILLVHTSLDGFCAGPKGEMDWITVNDEIFEAVGHITDDADTALYGRTTYGMMEGYWPTAASRPNATQHDVQHSNWYNAATKVVFSTTMAGSNRPDTHVISNNIPQAIAHIKKQPGKNLLLIGSISIAQYFTAHQLIDEYWINVNPVILGGGLPLFKSPAQRIGLRLLEAKPDKSGVVTLRYETNRP